MPTIPRKTARAVKRPDTLADATASDGIKSSPSSTASKRVPAKTSGAAPIDAKALIADQADETPNPLVIEAFEPAIDAVLRMKRLLATSVGVLVTGRARRSAQKKESNTNNSEIRPQVRTRQAARYVGSWYVTNDRRLRQRRLANDPDVEDDDKSSFTFLLMLGGAGAEDLTDQCLDQMDARRFFRGEATSIRTVDARRASVTGTTGSCR